MTIDKKIHFIDIYDPYRRVYFYEESANNLINSALDRINDDAIYLKIAMNEKLSIATRTSALERIKGETVLNNLVKTYKLYFKGGKDQSANDSLFASACDKISDESLLFDIAVDIPDKNICQSAIQKINNPDILFRILTGINWTKEWNDRAASGPLIDLIVNKMPDKQKLVEMLMSRNFLPEIFPYVFDKDKMIEIVKDYKADSKLVDLSWKWLGVSYIKANELETSFLNYLKSLYIGKQNISERWHQEYMNKIGFVTKSEIVKETFETKECPICMSGSGVYHPYDHCATCNDTKQITRKVEFRKIIGIYKTI